MRTSGRNFETTYFAYDMQGKLVGERSDLVGDSAAREWGSDLNESHYDEFFIVADRGSTTQTPEEIGHWGVTVRYRNDPITHKLTRMT